MTSSDLTVTGQQKAHSRSSTIAAHPVAWLAVALAGAMLLFAGIATEVYRHDHGADAAELVSLSNPGVLIAFAGIILLVGGVLAALTTVVFQSAATADDVIARGAGLVAVWTIVVAAGAGAITYAATAGITLGHEGHAVATPADAPSNSAAGGDAVPGESDRATLRGTLTLDGAPLDTQFLGARTIRGGLTTACQATIPNVTQGQYEITIAADSEVRGCGDDASQIVLWAFINDDYVYTTTTADWPGDGEDATFDAAFSSQSPLGATTPAMGLKGELFDRDGAKLPAGTVVEAYIGDMLCGITSLRYGDSTENLYTLYIAGPQAIPECAAGATITFRLNGAPARETITNTPTRPDDGRLTNLTLE